MSKKRTILGLLISCILLISLLNCASTSTSSSTGEYLDDTVITTKVKALLVKDAALKSFQVSVKTFKGVVQLSGFVDTARTRDRAEEITRSVDGVKSIKNNLILK